MNTVLTIVGPADALRKWLYGLAENLHDTNGLEVQIPNNYGPGEPITLSLEVDEDEDVAGIFAELS